MMRNNKVNTIERHKQPQVDLGAKQPFGEDLDFFFFPPDFLGLVGGVPVVDGFSLNEIFARWGGGVGRDLWAGGVVMLLSSWFLIPVSCFLFFTSRLGRAVGCRRGAS